MFLLDIKFVKTSWREKNYEAKYDFANLQQKCVNGKTTCLFPNIGKAQKDLNSHRPLFGVAQRLLEPN